MVTIHTVSIAIAGDGDAASRVFPEGLVDLGFAVVGTWELPVVSIKYDGICINSRNFLARILQIPVLSNSCSTKFGTIQMVSP